MMNCQPTEIHTSLALRLVVPEENTCPLRASLAYRADDPYAVHVVFHSGLDDGDISWTFSRELLAEGLERQSGIGDVTIWPWAGRGTEVIGMALSSPDGYALFELSRSAVEEFLARSYGVVPAGGEAEFINIDAELAALGAAPDTDVL